MFGFNKNMPDMPGVMDIMKRAMQAHVEFSTISFVCNGWCDEEAFTVRDTDLANAFIALVEEFPDADLTELDIHCRL